MTFRARRRKNRNRREIFLWLVTLAAAGLTAACVLIFVGERTKVIGSSMEPKLHDGDQVILDKITYRFQKPKRFEIVVFPGPEGRKKLYVKRIIGLPGETVKISDGKVYINGQEIAADYAKDHMTPNGNMKKELTLDKDEYFVMGDNRNNSRDSRYLEVGPVKRSEIIGRVVFRIYPWKQAGTINKDEL